MPQTENRGLFEPTLAEGPSVRPTYSIRSQYLVAFFGGPIAIALFGALAARLLGRLKQDAWLFALIGLGAVAQLATAYYFVGGDEATADMKRNARLVNRVASLVWVGVLFLRYRSFHRALDLTGQDRPNPWKPALACIAASFVLALLLAFTFPYWIHVR